MPGTDPRDLHALSHRYRKEWNYESVFQALGYTTGVRGKVLGEVRWGQDGVKMGSSRGT